MRATRLVLAGGVWLRGHGRPGSASTLPIKVLVNQLVVTERMPPVMRTVLGVASGLLSLKQYANGTVLIGGGWQGIGDRARGGVAVRPENFLGNVRLAAHTVPALREARVVRSWLGLEAETADALPAIGPIPGVDDAWIIGSVHSGYTSGPYMGTHPGAGDAGPGAGAAAVPDRPPAGRTEQRRMIPGPRSTASTPAPCCRCAPISRRTGRPMPCTPRIA